MKYIYIPFSKILEKKLIKEGDILLFRNKGIIAFIIQTLTNGKYSHIGMATWSYNGEDILELTEIREWYGGRTIVLKNAVNSNTNGIDVYRISSPVYKYKSKIDENYILQIEKIKLEYDGRLVSNCLRNLSGINYGYKRICEIWARHIPILRFFMPWDFEENRKVYPICSSAISYCVRDNFTDLVHFAPDKRTSPADISRSPLTNYLFTILKDG